MSSEFDRALLHEIMCIGAEDNFDLLEAEAENFPDDGEEESPVEPVEDVEDYESPDWLDDDRMDIDIPRQIPGITLNGGPVFEDEF